MNNEVLSEMKPPLNTAAPEDAGPEAYFKLVVEACETAAEAAGGFIDCFYKIGGLDLRLRFAGPALIPRLAQAISHLAIPESRSPSLTVYLWDSASTDHNMPAPPWTLDDHLARGEIRGYNTPRFRTVFQGGADSLSMYDAESGRAIYWVNDARRIPYYESGTPLRTILHWWTSGNSLQIAHAGAVGTLEGGVLLAGKGGVGKSSTTLACLDSGLLFAGDDYVLIGTEPSPFIYSLYNSAKLDTDGVQRFPHLANAIANPGRLADEKAVLFLRDLYPDKISAGFPAKALLVPVITGKSDTKVERISAIAGLTALAPSSIFQLPGAGRDAFQTLSRFAKQVPCYRIKLGTDLAEIPLAIRAIIEEG